MSRFEAERDVCLANLRMVVEWLDSSNVLNVGNDLDPNIQNLRRLFRPDAHFESAVVGLKACVYDLMDYLQRDVQIDRVFELRQKARAAVEKLAAVALRCHVLPEEKWGPKVWNVSSSLRPASV